MQQIEAAINSSEWTMSMLLATSFTVDLTYRATILEFNLEDYEILYKSSPWLITPSDSHINSSWFFSDPIKQVASVPKTMPGVHGVSILLGTKGSMKSFVTKRYVKFMAPHYHQLGLSVGRVDSDAYGKWVQASFPTFSSWSTFDSFQNDDEKFSVIELNLESQLKIFNVGSMSDIPHESTFKLVFEWFKLYFYNLITDSDYGLAKFSKMVQSIPDVPKFLIWESHVEPEIGMLPPTRYIAKILPPYDPFYAVSGRKRSTSNETQQWLYSLYNELSSVIVYRPIQIWEIMSYLAYGIMPSRRD